jgi:glycosyltransferase involved in cell wall biosynthesis
MRIVLLTNDNREIQKRYHVDKPVFGPAPEALLEGFKQFPEVVEIHVVSCLQRMPAHSPTKLAENIFYHPLHVRKSGWLRTGYQGCIRAVRRKIAEIRPDVVHGQGTERDCAISAVLSGYPNILTIHGYISRIAELTRAKPFTYYWLAKKLEGFCLQRTGGVVCLTSYNRRIAAPYARVCWTVPNAVHPSFFRVGRSPVTPPRVLCVANVHPWKNQLGLIKALEPLRASFDFELVFSGAGHDSDPYYRRLSEVVAARPWCRYLGPLNREDLQAQMSQACLGVLPSFEDNCPMVVLEAAAAGLPFAASNIGGIPDLIEKDRTGCLFDPEDPSDVAQVVGKLLRNRTHAEALAESARALCRERNSCETVARRHMDIYCSVIASESPAYEK